MKDYFNFNLKAQKLLTVWILFLVVIMVPYVYVIVHVKDFMDPHHPTSILGFYGIILLLVIAGYALLYFIYKLTIEGVEFKGSNLVFEGTFGEFLGRFILGMFLTIITLGIYSPWFIKNIYKFFVDNTSHNSNKLEFGGTAGKLFKILFFATFLPIMAMVILLVSFHFKAGQADAKTTGYISNAVMIFIMIPYMYYFYKWRVNINFREYAIRWETGFWTSCGKILKEVFLSLITAGIFYPVALLRLYQYFLQRTFAVSESNKKGFGYDLEAVKDFLLIWGQMFLTLVTLGIYYPWAFCKITNRILGKTYVEQLVEE